MVLQGSQQKKVMNLYQPVFVSYIDAKAGTVMSVTRGNLSHTEMKYVNLLVYYKAVLMQLSKHGYLKTTAMLSGPWGKEA